MAQRHGRRRPSFELHRTNDSPEAVMSHSLRFASRLLAVIGATATMIALAATAASAMVPPPDPGGSGTGPAPGTDGLVIAIIIATAVVAVAMAGILWLRSSRAHAARQARPAASTTG
jgi:hypothetical protein